MPHSRNATFAPAAPAREGTPAGTKPAASVRIPAVPSRLLIIGYGNTLFADDGLGPLVAQQVADWCAPGVLALERHELLPELAADLAAAEEAIFVDAALAGARVCLTRLAPPAAPTETPAAHLNHALTPAALLRLSAALYGRAPAAWLLTIPGADFSLGGALSETARAGLAEAVAMLRQRI
ncbi:MAG: hydrogenase maturation protease [Candidatus Didemnitutus sp.]|nr:hydrogenase maturation protease [Candidatus Didemnitutus sp.]